MRNVKIYTLQYLTYTLGLVLMAVLVAGCVSVSPTPSSTLAPGPRPRNIVGQWQGCIRGDDWSPNERIALKITSEQSNGSFDGKYIESYQRILADSRTANDEGIFSAQINKDNRMKFSVFIQIGADVNVGDTKQHAGVTWTYHFQGILVDMNTIQGQVNEVALGGHINTYNWFLSDKDDTCPF